MNKVFIDTNVIKFSATKQRRLLPVNRPTRNWYGKVTGYQLAELGYYNPNEKLNIESEIRQEAELLPEIADIAKLGHIKVLEDIEMMIESMGLPSINCSTGRFYGAPINRADRPIEYSRVIIGPNYMGSPKQLAMNFLKNIDNSRFKEIQKVTGAYQGENKYNHNQLIDAYLLWCAEYNKAKYFLTLDFKLIKMARGNKRIQLAVEPVKPSELLSKLPQEIRLTKRSTRHKKLRFLFPPFSRRRLP
jgi:hypothetical protein